MATQGLRENPSFWDLRYEIRTVRSAWASGHWRGLGWARLDWGSVPRPVSLRCQWGGAARHPETSRER